MDDVVAFRPWMDGRVYVHLVPRNMIYMHFMVMYMLWSTSYYCTYHYYRLTKNCVNRSDLRTFAMGHRYDNLLSLSLLMATVFCTHSRIYRHQHSVRIRNLYSNDNLVHMFTYPKIVRIRHTVDSLEKIRTLIRLKC